MSKLFILVGVIVGVILFATYDILESVRQVRDRKIKATWKSNSPRVRRGYVRESTISVCARVSTCSAWYTHLMCAEWYECCLTIAFLAASPLVFSVGPQFIFYILSFAILVYYVSQIVVLFVENALRDVALVHIAFKSVHLITGIVIMVPVLLLSFIPLFVDLQTRMLFNEDFSQRYGMIWYDYAYMTPEKSPRKNAGSVGVSVVVFFS